MFDEDRYFKRGDRPLILEWGEVRIGLTICEDLWYAEGAELGEVDMILNLSSSPYHYRKGNIRERMFGTRAADSQALVAFCNMVGGQDELVFDGGSMIFNPRGEVIARAQYFKEELMIADLDLEQVFRYRLHEPRIRKQVNPESAEKMAKRVRLSDPPFAKAKKRAVSACHSSPSRTARRKFSRRSCLAPETTCARTVSPGADRVVGRHRFLAGRRGRG